MKPVLVELHSFFKDQGFEANKINIKLTAKGQVEYATGELEYSESSSILSIKRSIRAYNKKYQSKDWRFHNSRLDFKMALNGKNLIIFTVIRIGRA